MSQKYEPLPGDLIVDLKEILTGMLAAQRASHYTGEDDSEIREAMDVMTSIAAGIFNRLEPHLADLYVGARKLKEAA